MIYLARISPNPEQVDCLALFSKFGRQFIYRTQVSRRREGGLRPFAFFEGLDLCSDGTAERGGGVAQPEGAGIFMELGLKRR